MEVRCFPYRPEAWRFKTITEFKDSVNRGAEINFEWNGREYHICPVWPDGEVQYCITPLDTQQDTVFKLRRTCWNISLTIPGCVTSLRRRK